MAKILNTIIDNVDSLFSWVGFILKQDTSAYCHVETADSEQVLVSQDGSLMSVIKVHGANSLLGGPEFERLHDSVATSWRAGLTRLGHGIQVYYNYDLDGTKDVLKNILKQAEMTAERLELDLNDVFKEKVNYLSSYTSNEEIYIALWSRPSILTKEQQKQAVKDRKSYVKKNNIGGLGDAQRPYLAVDELREIHGSFVRAMVSDLNLNDVRADLLDVHDAVHAMRNSADPEFTDVKWRPYLPGDKIPVRLKKHLKDDPSELMWPSLAKQILPRDAENVNLRMARVGDRLYSTVFIDLFPKEVQPFLTLFQRTLSAEIPWRMSFLMESTNVGPIRLKGAVASILAFANAGNALIRDSVRYLSALEVNSDDALVKLRVAATTWAPIGKERELRSRAAQLAKAIQGWGTCDVSEYSGDAYSSVISTMLGVSSESDAVASIAPLSDVIYMLPLTRPASPWSQGAVLFRSPDGRPWPYQPGSSMQTTWIDLIYARPGSGKSVLSNAINFALCLQSGLKRLPRISVVDIGPSSSGLISLLKEALPAKQRHLVAYHRLQMTPDYAINPFDTQLGCRKPSPQERSFLVNLLSLLCTPVGAEKPYDGISDMSGMVIDESYKSLADNGKPHVYTPGIDNNVDNGLEEIGFMQDPHTTWWEVTDALFLAGFIREAGLAQRYAVPVLADVASICRNPAIEDLFGDIKVATGESLIDAFSRMISSAIREYPILSSSTRFDLGEARVVALDLDEVAKSGGDAADRQTAVMYMLSRYVLARHYYLTEENVSTMPQAYQDYHRGRIAEIREDPKRIVYDEFHRTAKAQAVRDQVILDMREGRKWKVQIALLSQSIDDFDDVMVDFGTSIFIMDAGPAQAIKRSAEIFGLSETAQLALKTRVHGPKEGGGTFLAQFATKYGSNTQLLTLTLGPAELWALSTTAEDANVRNQLYRRIGPDHARRLLARLFPSGSITKVLEKRLMLLQEDQGMLTDDMATGAIDQLVEDILKAYSNDPNVKQFVV